MAATCLTASPVTVTGLQAELLPIFSSRSDFTNALCIYQATLSNIMLQLKPIKQLVHISVQPGSIFLGTSAHPHIKSLVILIHKTQTHYPDTLQVASRAKINRAKLGWSRVLINPVLSSNCLASCTRHSINHLPGCLASTAKNTSLRGSRFNNTA